MTADAVNLWGKGNPYSLLMGVWIVEATMEICIEVPERLEIDLSYDPAIPLLGIEEVPEAPRLLTFLLVALQN